MMDKEKQISVDPVSILKASSANSKDDHCSSYSVPPITNNYSFKDTSILNPIPLLPPKSKFLSFSLPSSATSSPRSAGSLLLKNRRTRRNQSQLMTSPLAVARQHSLTASSLVPQRGGHELGRSKSCGEGRACNPFDEFDIGSSRKVNSHLNQEMGDNESYFEYEIKRDHHENDKELDHNDAEEFKCGALCMFLPGFGKGKQVREKKEEGVVVVSRTVSLEKFECGSWASSALINDDEEGRDSMQLYFDLPLELIRNGANDAHSPVSTAFVFERERKSVLKKSTSRGSSAGKPHESTRHVRFSTSSSSPCISPRLRKAREDFNAFLEAQGA